MWLPGQPKCECCHLSGRCAWDSSAESRETLPRSAPKRAPVGVRRVPAIDARLAPGRCFSRWSSQPSVLFGGLWEPPSADGDLATFAVAAPRGGRRALSSAKGSRSCTCCRTAGSHVEVSCGPLDRRRAGQIPWSRLRRHRARRPRATLRGASPGESRAKRSSRWLRRGHAVIGSRSPKWPGRGARLLVSLPSSLGVAPSSRLLHSSAIARAAGSRRNRGLPAALPRSAAAEDAFGSGFGDPSENAPATIRGAHQYTLTECRSAGRNFSEPTGRRGAPRLRACAAGGGDVDPWFQWSAQSSIGLSLSPRYRGRSSTRRARREARNIVSSSSPLSRFVRVRDHRRSASPYVRQRSRRSAGSRGGERARLSEWRDMEKARDDDAHGSSGARTHGLQLARGREGDLLGRERTAIGKWAVQEIKDKARHSGDARTSATSIDCGSKSTRERSSSQSLQAPKGELYVCAAALRFMTGVQASFDVPDEPLKRPDRPLVSDRAVPRGRARPATRT